jgi:hypothetical protein
LLSEIFIMSPRVSSFYAACMTNSVIERTREIRSRNNLGEGNVIVRHETRRTSEREQKPKNSKLPCYTRTTPQ